MPTGTVDRQVEDALGERGVAVMGTVGTETRGTLEPLGHGPLCDAQPTEETTAACDAVRVVWNQLKMCVCACACACVYVHFVYIVYINLGRYKGQLSVHAVVGYMLCRLA